MSAPGPNSAVSGESLTASHFGATKLRLTPGRGSPMGPGAQTPESRQAAPTRLGGQEGVRVP